MYHLDAQKAAAERVAEELAKPISDNEFSGDDEFFDPWKLFPGVYGSYSAAFDWLAVDVLEELQENHVKVRGPLDIGAVIDSLGSPDTSEKPDNELAMWMFKEMLCVQHLCDYGTSPRGCFATTEFGELLPALIVKWKLYYEQCWKEKWDDVL